MKRKYKVLDSDGISYYSTCEYFEREYEWKYNGYTFTHKMTIPKDEYYYYKNLGHGIENITKYTTDKYNRDLVRGIANSMTNVADKLEFNDYQKVMMVISFVQSLPYTNDKETTGCDEYVRYPIETLVYDGGDCEDSAILLAALLREMRYGVILLEFKRHIAIGVKGGDEIEGTYYEYKGDKYYYIETTGENWDIGQIPDDYDGKNAVAIYVP